MKIKKNLTIIFLLLSIGPIHAFQEDIKVTYKPRIINTTDLGADPDDEQSMVRQLVCSNEFDIEGLIVSTGIYKKNQENTLMLDKLVEAYAKVYPNLTIHAKDYPNPEYLKSISVLGQTGYGMGDVGEGKDSPGSELIIASVDKDDPRPVWVMGWGGMNTVAQALWKVRETRTPEALAKFVQKLRLYDIYGQDDAGAWIAKNFPEVVYLRARGMSDWQPEKNSSYYRDFIQNQGPLGAAYPDSEFVPEGDTPSFLHVYPNGLNDPEKIDQGGWGGRFSARKRIAVRSLMDVYKNDPDVEKKYDPYFMYVNTDEGVQAIKKWSNGYNNDFVARMKWSVTDQYDKANHHPIAVLNGDTSRQVLEMTATAGTYVNLSASGSFDPDQDDLVYAWIFYREPSSYKGLVPMENSSAENLNLKIPMGAAGKSMHMILEIYDTGSPNLYAYRRMVIHVSPSSEQ
jgi:hypothetical protein